LRWVNVELTIALDLYSRSLVGLRLSPASTKAVDAALIVYEAVVPDSRALTSRGVLPYVGLPSVVVVDADRLDRSSKRRSSTMARSISPTTFWLYAPDWVSPSSLLAR
jgi:hypothetical protein